MCDDFFEDYFEDNIFDCDKDYDEDCADEYVINGEELIDVFDGPGGSPEQEEQRSFDLAEALIFGSMIYGNAYEEMLDDKSLKKTDSIGKKSEK